MRIASLIIALLVPGMLLIGCAAPYTNIRGEDNSVLFPGIRIDHPFVGRGDRPGAGRLAVEFEAARGTGTDQQELLGNERIALGGREIIGPASVQQHFTLDMASLALRVRTERTEPFFVDLILAGLRATRLDLTLDSGSAVAQDVLRDTDCFMGIGVGRQVSDAFMLEARFTSDVLPLNLERGRMMQSFDLFGTLRIRSDLAVVLGLRSWKYSIETEGSDISSLRWSGLSAGLLFDY